MATSVLAIDPGDKQSAYIVYGGGRPSAFGKLDNHDLLERLEEHAAALPYHTPLVIEMIASYGMPVGREVFETCVWIGRFIQRWPFVHHLVYRRDVKLHLCGSARAKDTNIRQSLLDRFGGKSVAVGDKKQPGFLYGVKSDVWSALALAVTFADGQALPGGGA